MDNELIKKWFDRIRSMIPSWFSRGLNASALLNGLASLLAAMEKNLGEHIKETFIDTSRGEFLDMIGEGRGRPREADEQDPEYRDRIRSISNSSNCAAIKRVVDNLLLVGQSRVSDSVDGVFLDGSVFCNTGNIVNEDRNRKSFSVVIPRQETKPLSFLGFSYLDGNSFLSSDSPGEFFYNRIYRAVENEKAFGILWTFHVQ